MAIAFDTTSNASHAGSVSWSHTVTGSNTILVVGIFSTNGSGSDIITDVTYNSVAMTRLSGFQTNSGSKPWHWMYLYYLINPATGANTVAITASASDGITKGQALSYTGVNQSGFPDASNTTSGLSATGALTVSVTVVASNCWLGSFVWQGSSSDADFSGTGSTGTKHANSDNNLTATDSNGTVATGAETAGASTGGVADEYGVVGFSVAPVASAGTTPNLHYLSLLGVGT